MPPVNVRRERRYEVAFPVSFWWSQAGTVRSGEGITRDISTRGVCVITTECPPQGALVQLRITLPRMDTEGQGIDLCGEGVVLRNGNEGQSLANSEAASSFAASIHLYPEQEREAAQPVMNHDVEVFVKSYLN